MHGHPNQSGHITSSTAQCYLDDDSEGHHKHNLIQKAHLYHHCWSVNTTCLCGCEVS